MHLREVILIVCSGQCLVCFESCVKILSALTMLPLNSKRLYFAHLKSERTVPTRTSTSLKSRYKGGVYVAQWAKALAFHLWVLNHNKMNYTHLITLDLRRHKPLMDSSS